MAFFVRHPNAANLLMAALILTGLISSTKLNVQFFPTVDVPTISIGVTWSGASAVDVDTHVVATVEPAVRFLDGVDTVTSTSREGRASIRLDYVANADMQKAVGDVEAALEKITTLPEGSKKPVVVRAIFYETVTSILLSGPFSERALIEYAKIVRDDLLKAGVDNVKLVGARDEAIYIEVDEAQLRRHNLTLDGVARTVDAVARDQPLGVIKGENERLLRGQGRAYSTHGIGRIAVKALPNGETVQVNHIADVRAGFAEDQVEGVAIDGHPAIRLNVRRAKGSHTLRVSEIASERLEVLQAQLPPTLNLHQFNVRSDLVVQRISTLTRNGLQGLALVVGLLFIFLSWRMAGWVAAGIATAMLGSLTIFWLGGESINMISLFALLLMTGIVVDDAIVVAEHAVSLREQGHEPQEAAILAARRMAGPVIASSLTTIVAFLPIFLITDVLGQIMGTLAVVVTLVVVASLLECFVILPSHAAHALKVHHKPKNFTRAFRYWQYKHFRRFVARAYNHRYLVLCAMIGGLIITGGLIGGGKVPFRFFPSPEAEVVNANIYFIPGTPREEIHAAVNLLLDALHETEESFAAGKLVRTVFARVDTSATVYVELTPSEERTVRTQAFIRAWRTNAPRQAGLEQITIREQRGGPPGRDIAVRLENAPPDTLKAASKDLRTALRSFPGTTNIRDDTPYGKEEILLTLSPQGRAMGFTTADITRQLRSAYEGTTAQRFTQGSSEVTVRVRLADADRTTPLIARHLRSAGGGEVPLEEAVNTERKVGYATIRRFNGVRTLTVSSSTSAEASAENINPVLASEVVPKIAADHGISFSMGGRSEEQGEAFADVGTGLMVALVLIYIILAWSLGRYGQPLVIMSVIPFGLIGAVIGHMVMGYPVTILTMIALLGLSGIVVNDSIVLMSEINVQVARTGNQRRGIILGTTNRLRAVVLTSLTTICGLTPLLFEQSLQAQFLKPMAITLSWGVAFTTLVVLLLVPCLVGVGIDIRRGLRALFISAKMSARKTQAP